jgi:hypothetical protein
VEVRKSLSDEVAIAASFLLVAGLIAVFTRGRFGSQQDFNDLTRPTRRQKQRWAADA